MIAHWDEAESGRGEAGHIAGEWTDLGTAAGTKTVGLNRIAIDPGRWSTPLHRQTAEEEVFYVLGGSGICLLDGAAFEVGPGDCVVHRVRSNKIYFRGLGLIARLEDLDHADGERA